MVEHMLRTVHKSLVQGYCATADCATGDCARLHDKRYYCTTGKEKNTTSYARNNDLHKGRVANCARRKLYDQKSIVRRVRTVVLRS